MDRSTLREKDKLVLELIVEGYLEEGRPVSSGFVSSRKRFSGSSATIRNIMARLENYGYLSQPHTSSGRVPTDKGLKFYVDDLLNEGLFLQERADISSDALLKTGDFDSVLTQASKLLADYSDNLGFVLSPRLTRIHFHHLRFIKIAHNKVMVILVTPFQMVLTEIVETETPFSQIELDHACQYINQNFRGKNLVSVRDFLLQELPKYKLKYEDFINRLMVLLRTYVHQGEEENRIFLQGTSKLLNKAHLFDMEKLKTLFQNFEEKANLARLLSDFISLDRVKVLIGSEANFPDNSDCSLVLSHYGYENQVLGTLGIIGPKRIPYEKIIPLVDSIAKKLSRAITAGGKEGIL